MEDTVRRHELTDDAWARIAPLLPANPERGGRRRDHRQVLNGIVWKIRTGADWRDIPDRYGPWQTIYQRFRRWSADGTFTRLLEHVQVHDDAIGQVDRSVICVDSTIVRAHQHAAGARKGGIGHGTHGQRSAQTDQGRQALGRSRGGPTTEIHLAADGRGLPLAFVLTGGNVNDCTQFTAVMEAIRVPGPGPGRPRTRPAHVIADKGHSSRAIRTYLRRRKIGATIPERADQPAGRARRGHRRHAFDPIRYKRRNVVERCFNRLKHFKGIAIRYDKLAAHYRSAVTIACLLLWLR
ncbi:IS5 family transposase [Streptosporangium sandarakinum]|uniref:IS5 family transposase n=1 Tax=Streptosporangium sandarakinum TaxID=1260955 RepID=UPI003F4D30BE